METPLGHRGHERPVVPPPRPPSFVDLSVVEDVSDVTEAEVTNPVTISDDQTVTNFDELAHLIANTVTNATTAITTQDTDSSNKPTALPLSTKQSTVTFEATPPTTPPTATATTTHPSRSPIQTIEIDNEYSPNLNDDDDITVETRASNCTTSTNATSTSKKCAVKYLPLRKDNKFKYFNFMWPYPDADSLRQIKEVACAGTSGKTVEYCGFALEMGERGMPHYQGVFYVKNPRNVTGVYKLFDTKKTRPQMRDGVVVQPEKLVKNRANIIPVGAKADKNRKGAFVQVRGANPWNAYQYIMKGAMAHDDWKRHKADIAFGYGKDLNLVFEFGTRPTEETHADLFVDKRGTRTDVNANSDFMMRLDELVNQHFVLDESQVNIKDTLEEEFPEHWQRWPDWCMRQIDRRSRPHKEKPREERVMETLRQWQSDLLEYLENTKYDGRIVRIYWDPEGGCGKSRFKHHYRSLYPQWCVYLSPGAKKDLVSQYRNQSVGKNVKVFIMDCPRCKGEKGVGIPYDMIEQLLDGELWVSKYDSDLMTAKPPLVVMFMNHEPNYTKLSIDRIQLFKFPEIDDPNPLLDKDGNRMCVRMPVEYIKQRWREQKEIDDLQKNMKLNKLRAAPVFNHHVGPPSNSSNTEEHNRFVTQEKEKYFLDRDTRNSTDLSLKENVNVGNTPTHHKDNATVKERERKKRRKSRRESEIDPDFMCRITDRPPSDVEGPVDMAGDPTGVQAHQRLKERFHTG